MIASMVIGTIMTITATTITNTTPPSPAPKPSSPTLDNTTTTTFASNFFAIMIIFKPRRIPMSPNMDSHRARGFINVWAMEGRARILLQVLSIAVFCISISRSQMENTSSPAQCHFEGKDYQEGARYKSQVDPCIRCRCKDGESECSLKARSACKPVTCENPIISPGKCCPRCPGPNSRHKANPTPPPTPGEGEGMTTVYSSGSSILIMRLPPPPIIPPPPPSGVLGFDFHNDTFIPTTMMPPAPPSPPPPPPPTDPDTTTTTMPTTTDDGVCTMSCVVWKWEVP
nr:kielin/chordin-like protein [Lytechinus pictus]